MNIKYFAAALALVFALGVNSAAALAHEGEHGDHEGYEQQDSHHDHERGGEDEHEGERGEHEHSGDHDASSMSDRHDASGSAESGSHARSAHQKARTFVDILGDLLSF